MPSRFITTLFCPACSPPALLVSPTTLHCGHTVCAAHVSSPQPGPSSSSSAPSSSSSAPSSSRSQPCTEDAVPIVPSCPLITCRKQSANRIQEPDIKLPPNSTVAYYPRITPQLPPQSTQDQFITVPNPRVDVTISRVLSLIERARTWNNDTPSASRVSVSDHSDQEDEDETHSDNERRQSVQSNPGPHSRQDAPSPGRSDRRQSSPSRSPRLPTRPRKRRRKLSPSSRPGSPSTQSSTDIQARFHKELYEQLTCEICLLLLYLPVTTPCQHTFCAKCLHRTLDHGSKCPFCRQSMPPFSYFQDHPYNKVLLTLIEKGFPESHAERGRAIEAEERDARLDTPIFVCQLSFPGMPTLLHFFEPRYRLMLRRCLESPSPCFGMVMPPRTMGQAGSEYGTMLEIRSVQMLPDGRSMVETWGAYRFRILESGNLDGYMVGRIERIEDVPPELEDEVEGIIATATGPRDYPMQPTNEELIAICHAFLEQLRNGTAPWVVQRLNHTYGPMPTDPCRFSFWMALVLPIDEQEKAKLLPIKSARLRLRLVVHWIEQLNSNW